MCTHVLLTSLAEALEKGGWDSGSVAVALLSDCDGEIVSGCVTFDRDAVSAVPPSGIAGVVPTNGSFGVRRETTK